ncbi:TniQ family protein [Paracoccus aeridis]|uniref:TniQ family protein n=1 Tax=Paracoccus aeridis TaxID=1966466 RepID=UPI0010AAFB51|nr:TniQ family protein [Paracoccus aeridis]
MRLGLRLPILPGETLPSFVSALAAKNGSCHAQDFSQDMGLSWRRILQLDPDTVWDLSELTGIAVPDLVAHSFAPVGDGFFRFRDHELPLSSLDRSALRYCPVCLADDSDRHGRGYGRALWQIDPLRVCPDHGTLLDVLPAPTYPRCPHDFAGRLGALGAPGPVNQPEEFGHDATDFIRYIRARLCQDTNRTGLTLLDRLPVDVAARLCENLGILVTSGPDPRPQALSGRERATAGGCGFAICAQGSDALSAAYDTVRRRSTSDRGGFYSDFGFFARWLQRLSHPDRYRPVLDHFRTFVFDNYPLSPGQQVLGETSTERRWFTWSELGRAYGLSTGRITRFQHAAGIEGDALRRVAPDAYHAELTALSSGLDRKAAARRLDVHPSAVDGLAEVGLLRHGIALPGLDKLFLPHDVDAFFSAVSVHAQVVDTAPKGSFPIRLVCNKAKVTSGDLLRAQIAGRLRKTCRLRDPDGMPGLLFDLSEVLDLFEGKPLTGLTRADLKARLHVNSSTVSLLLKEGMIMSREVRHPRSRQPLTLVEPADLSRFLSKHLPLGLIAHQLGTQAKHVAARLDKATVRPIPLPDHCSKIYLRDAVIPVISI